jgi:flagellar M-ring protein FliF
LHLRSGQNGRKHKEGGVDNLQTFWTGLSIQRRAIVAAATVGMFAIIMLMARAANAPDYALLYAGLDANSAGEVIVALDATGATYDVRGTSIFVESATRDQLRMTLAAEGLPASSTSGYEILEKMTGFGTTSQMFDAAYWRAKEGELARTITGSSGVKSARVHISNAGATPFQRNDNVTASVTLQTAGLPVNASQARAIQFLVASAVTGLTPASVTVIDGQTGSIISADADAVAGADREGRSVTLQKRVERLMAARVGPHSYVVEVSVETDLDEEVMVERTLDPDSRVIISTDSEERSTQANDSVAGGAVTVASNLPTGDAAADDRSSSSQNASNRERINYDVSATEREVKRAAGSVKRITVAVMVDGVEIPDAAGTPVWQPRDASEIEALEALVQSAIGFDADRGDTVTIRSLQFDASIRPEPLVAPAESGSVLSQLDLQ